MKGISDSFEHAGKTYSWWAGHSDHQKEYCVHCRHEDYGLTRYLQDQPADEEAEELAKGLAPHVEGIKANASAA